LNSEGGRFLSKPKPLWQLGWQAAGAGDRLADAHLFLHVPDARGDRMDHGHFEVFLQRKVGN
jgi:hypothetical protein